MDSTRQHLKEALDNFNASVFSWAQTPGDYSLWISWGFSANYLLNAALPAFSDELQPNNLLKTQLLFELALQPIISHHYYRLYPSLTDPVAELKSEYDAIQSNIHRFLFGTEYRERNRLHLNLLSQLFHSLRQPTEEDRFHLLLLYCQLLEYRWIECCSDKHILEWNTLCFPCDTYEEVLDSRRNSRDELVRKTINPTNTITLCQIINQAFMFTEILFTLCDSPVKNESRQSWYPVVLSKLLPAEEELSAILERINPAS